MIARLTAGRYRRMGRKGKAVAERVVVLILGIALIIGLIAWLDVNQKDNEIPLPPAGHEYCVENGSLNFCEREM